MDKFYIEAVSLNHSDISHLLEESLSEGHRHIKRLFEEFASGKNTFSNEGEALFAAVINERIIGICGLNIDPFVEGKHVGRVRRLYVLKEFRRHGIGRSLMQAVIQEARNHYRVIVLNTDNPVADLFYRSLGFAATPLYPNATHHMGFGKQ